MTLTPVISCEICKIFKSTLFYRTSPVSTSEGFRFSACNFIKKETPEKMFFYEFAKFLRTSFLLNFHSPFQAFYTRTRRSHLKAFIYFKSLNIVCEVVNLLWRCQPVTLRKKTLLHISSCFLPSFSQNTSRLLVPKRLWKFKTQFLSGNVSGK